MTKQELLDEYISKYCVKHKIDRETALTHATVKSVAEYYEHVNDGKISVTEQSVVYGCGGADVGECK